jgi:NADPH2:quinone reductase
MMKAIAIENFGEPDVLRMMDLPDPVPGPGQVLVRVRAASVNPIDVAFRSGEMAHIFNLEGPPPYVPGVDAAGILERIGPDTTIPLDIGDAVATFTHPLSPRDGAYAELIVVDAASVVAAPAGTDFPVASAFLSNALSAQLTLDALAIPAGGTVAVTGAAGAVGGFAVELAAAGGLKVIADASAADEALVRGFGAQDIARRGDGFVADVRNVVPQGVDGLVDAAMLNAAALPAVRDNGGLAVMRGWDGPAERGITVHGIRVFTAAHDTAALNRLSRQVEQGILTVRVADILPACRAADAHRRVEAGGLRGRLVLEF